MQAQIKLKQGLAGPLGQLQTTARMIAEVQAECKLPVVADEYVESFKPDLMDVIFSWSKVMTSPVVVILACESHRFLVKTEGRRVNIYACLSGGHVAAAVLHACDDNLRDCAGFQLRRGLQAVLAV